MIFLGESMNHVQDIDIPEEIADDKIETNQDTLFELGPYTSLRLASNEIEPFYLAEVNDQGITNEKKFRFFWPQHFSRWKGYWSILSTISWTKKEHGQIPTTKEKAKCLYLHSRGFVSRIALDVDLKTTMEEYQSFLDAAFKNLVLIFSNFLIYTMFK